MDLGMKHSSDDRPRSGSQDPTHSAGPDSRRRSVRRDSLKEGQSICIPSLLKQFQQFIIIIIIIIIIIMIMIMITITITTTIVTCLSHVDEFSELASTRSVRSKDGRAIPVRILIDQADGVVKGVHFQAAQNWPKNLLFVARHLRLHNKCTQTSNSTSASKSLL